MPEKKLEIGVIGLGKFGLRMATTLVSLGHTVVGIDSPNPACSWPKRLWTRCTRLTPPISACCVPCMCRI